MVQPTNGQQRRNLLYVTASSVRDGTPVFTHVMGIVDGLREDGWTVDVRAPGDMPLDGFLRQFLRLVDVLYVQARALMEIGSFDAVYCRWHFALWPVALWARVRGVPVVQEVNGPYDDFFLAHPYMRWAYRIAVFLMRLQLRQSTAVVTVTEGLQSWIRNQVPEKRVEVVGNGADTQLFSPLALSAFDLPKPYVVFVGSLSRWQGIETMLDAFRRPEWPDRLGLAVAGDGPGRAQVEEAANGSGRLTYLGPIPHQQVPGLLAESLGGLTPQNTVGQRNNLFSALKLYETLACGVPIVSTEAERHSRIIVENDCGLVVPAEDPVALALAMKQLLDDPDESRAMGVRGREFIEREASWKILSRRTGALLSDIVGEHAAQG